MGARRQPLQKTGAARVLREMLLLGKQRTYGEILTDEEVSRLPGPGLRAMVESRDIELLGDLEATVPGREIAGLRREVAELRRLINRNENRINELVEHVAGLLAIADTEKADGSTIEDRA